MSWCNTMVMFNVLYDAAKFCGLINTHDDDDDDDNAVCFRLPYR